jgi:uncharacterized protein (DUF4415 family)
MRKLTKEQKRDIRVIAAKRGEDIDFSDAPRVLDWSGAEIGKFYRPTKKPVTMRLDSDVIAWLKADGRGYQTKANWLLRHAMTHFRKDRNISSRGSRCRRVGKSHAPKGKSLIFIWYLNLFLERFPSLATPIGESVSIRRDCSFPRGGRVIAKSL